MIIADALTILGLAVPVSRGELKGAFRTAAKTSHPDKTRPKDTSAFRTAKEAYDVLLPLVPLTADEVEPDEVEQVEPAPPPPTEEPMYSYTRPTYVCPRCGTTRPNETPAAGGRLHWTERQDYPGISESEAKRNTACRASALPNGWSA